MENTHSLLVALMFVTVLSIGIGTLLMGLSAVVDLRGKLKRDWIPISWLILLLLQHFNLFWDTLDILAVEQWGFAGFLYILTGPILLFLATSVMLPDRADAGPADPCAQYFRVARQFFAIEAMLMAWAFGVDLVFGQGLTAAGVWNAAAVALFLVLAASQRRRLHAVGTVLTWLLLLSLLTFRGLGSVE